MKLGQPRNLIVPFVDVVDAPAATKEVTHLLPHARFIDHRTDLKHFEGIRCVENSHLTFGSQVLREDLPNPLWVGSFGFKGRMSLAEPAQELINLLVGDGDHDQPG